MPTLAQSLEQAVEQCGEGLEEQGGIIMITKTEPYDYIFVKLANENSGTPQARSLWTADRQAYASLIIPLFKSGYKQYASFHTHPQWPAVPSHIDYRDLFPGFAKNYIYSGVSKEINRFDLIEGQWCYVEPLAQFTQKNYEHRNNKKN
jgi:hypothetical protein